jgi:hypothetical protein
VSEATISAVTINEASLIAAQIQMSVQNIKAGTPRVFGDWFGKPVEDRRIIVGAAASGSCLTLRLDAGETIRIWHPIGLECSREAFAISSATRVVLEWPPASPVAEIPQVPCFREYTVRPSGIEATTNVDRFTVRLQPKVGYPAIELS